MRVSILCLGLLGAVSVLADVPGWRGDGSGVFAASNPASTWSATAGTVWKTPIAKWSNACPMILGERVFVCSEVANLHCLDLASGRELWQKSNGAEDIVDEKEAAEMRKRMAAADALAAKLKPLNDKIRGLDRKARKKKASPEELAELKTLKSSAAPLKEQLAKSDVELPKCHAVTGYSTPTPATDGTSVFVLFGNGIAAKYDVDGKRVWARFVRKPSHQWGQSASPVVSGGLMIVHIANVVIALDVEDGTERWRTDGKGIWGSPTVVDVAGTAVLITTGVDVLRVEDGKKLAESIAKMPWTSPVVVDGVLYVADENECAAFALTESLLEGQKPEKLWSLKLKKDRYYASPVIHDGLLYTLNRKGHFSVVDVAKGELVYEKALKFEVEGGHTAYPSPVLAGDLLLISTDNGSTLVLKPGREYQELASNTLDPFRSSPVFSGDRMLVRTLSHLYCIGR